MDVLKGRYFIETYGCEMNDYDSALVEHLLQLRGMTPASDRKTADFLLINTCSVRRHAEQRVFSLLSQYKALKRSNPGLRIILMGCMGSRFGERLLEEFPHLDLVVGPDGYRKLPELLVSDEFTRRVWMGDNPVETYENLLPVCSGVSAGVAIARGCDNYCSYCIVPYVRGGERSRPAQSIIAEIEYLTAAGVKEITLLGQNVNSYNHNDINFPKLLREVDKVGGVERLRFLTSHPKDLSDELLEAMAECGSAAPHLHLPFQAGSDRILGLMKRGYSGAEYLALTEKARRIIPGISLTTDVIVGFPSERDEDYRATLDLIEAVRFDDAFTYRYSPREGTSAAGLTDDVPEAEKIERLEEVITFTRRISRENLEAQIGRSFTALVERASKKDSDYWMGRTEYNRIAIFPRGDYSPGDFVRVSVNSVSGFTLRCSSRKEAFNITI